RHWRPSTGRARRTRPRGRPPGLRRAPEAGGGASARLLQERDRAPIAASPRRRRKRVGAETLLPAPWRRRYTARMEPQTPPPARGRGIYLLPNLFTTGGLYAGFFAIIAASQGRYGAACIAIFVAAILDGIDGRVARLTNTQSEFGVQYDSLADLVSFGMAPALVMYHWALVSMKLDGTTLGKIGWLAAFLYAA